jgi:hypothetical protein
MPNTFKSVYVSSVGTTSQNFYTCPLSTQTVALGLSAANTTTNPTSVTFKIARGTPTQTLFNIITNANVPVGSSLVVIGGDQKMVLQAGDVLSVVAGASNAIDVIFSLLEIN